MKADALNQIAINRILIIALKGKQQMKTILAIVIVLALLIPAQPVSAGGCRLVIGKNRAYVTVSRGPCYVRDFPTWCRGHIPGVIIQGQKIRC